MSLDIPILACDRHTDVVGLTLPLLLTVAMQLVVTNDPHPHEYVTFSDFAYPEYVLCISCFRSFKIIWIPSRLVLSVPMKFIQETRRALGYHSFYYYHCTFVNTSASD